MCKSCGCEAPTKKIQYQCDCNDKDCTCDSVIGFDAEPQAVPYCCGAPMKRIK
ncbi:MAG: hypothetical protein JW840_02095 [Candidatus Thermoplasmatota archaeon]|nr:hypothetical protein [Candidatus Thermoplasmatota archaeon]